MKYRITIVQIDEQASVEVFQQTFENLEVEELIIRLNKRPRKRNRKKVTE